VGFEGGHAVCPAEQVWLQLPPAHTCPGAQALPQEPQFAGSFARFVQKALAPVPQASGVAAGQAQLPFAQAWPAGQALPQAPQLFASVEVEAQ